MCPEYEVMEPTPQFKAPVPKCNVINDYLAPWTIDSVCRNNCMTCCYYQQRHGRKPPSMVMEERNKQSNSKSSGGGVGKLILLVVAAGVITRILGVW